MEEDDGALRGNYYSRLLQLCNDLTEKNLEDLRFLLKGQGFGARDVEDKNALKIMELLQNHGKISEKGNSFLYHRLLEINRKDLINKYFVGGLLILEEFAPIYQSLNIPFDRQNVASYLTSLTSESRVAETADAEESLYSSQAGSSYQNLVSTVQSFSAFAPNPNLGTAEPAPSRSNHENATVPHQLCNLKIVDHEIEVPVEEEETQVKEALSEEPRAPISAFSVASQSSVASDSVAADGPFAATIISVEERRVSADQMTRPIIDVKVEPPGGAVGACAVESDGALESALAVVSAKSDQTAEDSAIVSAMGSIRLNDSQALEDLPLIEGADRVDHDRILTQIGMNFEMRKYQRTLAEPGLRGESDIIVLQTGGGKTHVAAYVTKYHHEKAMYQDKRFLALFLVPLRLLAEQQGNIFEGLREPDQGAFSSLDVGIANDTLQFMDHVRKKQVIFCTAQILVNILRDKIFKIDMRHFSLIVIDECHRTSGRHPNNRVMEQYFKLKLEEHTLKKSQAPDNLYRTDSSTNLPLIIGLTASLGAGKPNKSQSVDRNSLAKVAFDHLTEMCSNLDALKVTFLIAEDDLANLAHHCPDPADQEIVPIGRRYDRSFYKLLHAFVIDTLRGMKNPIDIGHVTLGEKECYDYFKQFVTAEEARSDDEVYIAATYLMEFNKAFAKLKILRCQDVLEFLEVNKDLPFYSDAEDIKCDFVAKTKSLWTKKAHLIKDHAVTVDQTPLPIMAELKSKLLGLIRDEDDRGIVLVRERYSTTALARFVKDDNQLSAVTERGIAAVRPTILVGKDDMSDTDQVESLRKFRTGECNLMIATDIAQEGIDIRECNFVISYNFVSNEIGTVQAAGRARRAGSKSYLLVLKESPELEQAKKVRGQIQAMKDALTKYKKINTDGSWETRIRKRQTEVYKRRKDKREFKLRNLEAAAKYDIVCGKCRNLVTPADRLVKIRETNHHLLAGDDIDEVVIRKELSEDKNDHGDEVVRLYGIYCSHCQTHKLGVEFQFKRSIRFCGPQVSVKAEQVKYMEKERRNPLPKGKFKWKDAPFSVASESYSFEMNSDFSDDDDDDFDF